MVRSGGKDRNCCEGSWRERWKRARKVRVDLLRVNKIEAVQVGQDVCRLLEYTMKLTEGNSNSVKESNLVSMWLHLEEPYRGPAAEKAGWSIEWRSAGAGAA